MNLLGERGRGDVDDHDHDHDHDRENDDGNDDMKSCWLFAFTAVDLRRKLLRVRKFMGAG